MTEPARESREGRRVRADLVIAVCALFVSSLATAATWWQSRVVAHQLSAQVWPYLSVSETFGSDSVAISVANDGLGPAVLRSAVVAVDGKPQPGFVAVVHALLGPDLGGRAKRAGETINVGISSAAPGSVLRAGATVTVFTLKSKLFAQRFMRESRRLEIRTCYCSIEGACWNKSLQTSDDPQPVARCPVEASDLLRAHPQDELRGGL